jgi:hypothetical protein
MQNPFHLLAPNRRWLFHLSKQWFQVAPAMPTKSGKRSSLTLPTCCRREINRNCSGGFRKIIAIDAESHLSYVAADPRTIHRQQNNPQTIGKPSCKQGIDALPHTDESSSLVDLNRHLRLLTNRVAASTMHIVGSKDTWPIGIKAG